jgi:hypothetical protein
MKANELRIGNYYNQFGNIYQVSCNTLVELEQAPIDQLWCKPIPLTEEWFLKFGWELDHESNDLKSFINYKLDLDAINFSPSRNEFYYNCWEDSKCPKYVHQLQNLYFALTGEEIVVKE